MPSCIKQFSRTVPPRPNDSNDSDCVVGGRAVTAPIHGLACAEIYPYVMVRIACGLAIYICVANATSRRTTTSQPPIKLMLSSTFDPKVCCTFIPFYPTLLPFRILGLQF